MESTSILLNEDNSIRVIVNGVEKLLAKEWLTGDGRAANTILAKQILGTEEGFQGTNSLTLNEELFPFFDLVIDWLSNGDDHTRPILSAENAIQLNDLAIYFGLDGLLNAIQEEKRKRQQQLAHLEEEAIFLEEEVVFLEGEAADLEGETADFEAEAAAMEQRVVEVKVEAAAAAREVAQLYEQRMMDIDQRVRNTAQRMRAAAQRTRTAAQRTRTVAPRARDTAQRARDAAQQLRGSFPYESIPT